MDESRSSPPTSMLEDSQLVAFLKLKGHGIVAFICKVDPDDPNYRYDSRDPHVAFDIKGNEDQIQSDVQSFYDNERVGIQDYCRCLKDVKSLMYSMRKLKRT